MDISTVTCHPLGRILEFFPIGRRSPLNRAYVTRFSHALRSVFSHGSLVSVGRATGHCRRLRTVTPQRLVCALVEALGAYRIRTIADILRTFNAQNELAVRYKAFHNRLAKTEFAGFMCQVYQLILRDLSQKVLRSALGQNLRRFTDIVVQDGSSFAVHDDLAEIFGGRFTKNRPAAVELHAYQSVFQDQAVQVQVAPDRQGERDFLPRPEALKGKLLLADRGYPCLEYFEQVIAAGASFLMRNKTNVNPRVIRVHGCGRRLPRHEGYLLRDVLRWLPRRRLDLDVQWGRPAGGTLQLRLVLIWVASKKQYTMLVTNVPRSTLSAGQAAAVYRLRWQIELMFKEWKSHCNLHEFDSAKPALVEGLIWASLCAAALKRSLAHAGQRCGASVPLSTHVTAMCGPHILPDLLRCALRNFRGLRAVIEKTLRFLWDNAQRAHPERDRARGRMRFGLDYVGLRA
jgi:hypothetical protein